MSEVHNLNQILEEIIEDERISTSKNRKVSQAEIRQMLQERQKLTTADDPSRMPLGEALVQQGLISAEQLQEGLEAQLENGGKLGSILIQLGFISDQDLLQFLATQHATKSTDLFDVNIREEVLNLLPFRIIRTHKVLPLEVEDHAIHLAMENPKDFAAINEVEFFTGKRVNASVVPSYQIDLAIEYLDEKGTQAFSGSDIRQILQVPVATKNLLHQLVTARGFDLILSADSPPCIRFTHSLKKLSMPAITPDECVAHAKTLMDERQWQTLLSDKQVQFVVTNDQLGRFRVNAYRQRDTVSLAIRYLQYDCPSCATLGLPGWLEDCAGKRQGLIIFASPPGQGKTTTLAAMVETINNRGGRNIITLEDPIEYLYTPKNCAISQRQIGRDVNSFAEGLRTIYRQSPDVIVISEIRDYETLKMALEASTSGHLVLTTVPATSVIDGLNDMLTLIPQHLQARARQQLANALILLFCQRLLPGKDRALMVVAHEKLVTSNRVKQLVSEGTIEQLKTESQTQAEDFSSLETDLMRLLEEQKITAEDALLCGFDQMTH